MKFIAIEPKKRELLYVVSDGNNIIKEDKAADFFEIEYIRIENEIERKNVLVEMGYRRSVFLACRVLEWTPVKGMPTEGEFFKFRDSKMLPDKFFANDIRTTEKDLKCDRFLDCKKMINNYIKFLNKNNNEQNKT